MASQDVRNGTEGKNSGSVGCSDDQSEKKRGENWTEESVFMLIRVWKDFFRDLRTTPRNRHIYERMRKRLLEDYHITRTAAEIKHKVTNLAKDYRRYRRQQSDGTPCNWKFWEEVNEIISGNEEFQLEENTNANNDEYLPENAMDNSVQSGTESNSESRSRASSPTCPSITGPVREVELIHVGTSNDRKRRRKRKTGGFDELLAEIKSANRKAAKFEEESLKLMKDEMTMRAEELNIERGLFHLFQQMCENNTN